MALTTEDVRRLEGPRSEAGAIVLRAAITGTVANWAAVAALGALARSEGRSAVAPINATSHVIHGDEAGSVDEIDLAHTGVGALINHGAAIFWALPYTWWLSRAPHRTTAEIALGAAATATVAGAVDYGLVPRRLTPGWEHAVSPRSVAATFGALAVGLAAGALVTRALDRL